MADKKGKKGMALVIAVGPKMPKSPTDTATPEKMKKYGSMPMKKAFELLKRYGAPDKRDLMAALGRTGYKNPSLVEDPEDYRREMAMREAKEGLRGDKPDEQNPLTMEEMMEADRRFNQMREMEGAPPDVRTGEPMDLAFRLLKESIDPKKLAEMRAARDAARAQLGQRNPNRGGDVDPM